MITKEQKAAVYKNVYADNMTDTARGLLGFAQKNVKIKISEKDRKDLYKQHTVTPLCHCAGCVELAKIFIDNSNSLKEHVIGVSMQDAEEEIKRIR